MVEGRSRGVITDLDGTFVIEVLPTDKLADSFLGMETRRLFCGKQTNIVV
ncbi:carboxypeptidase-like regulatory domain-containing protein [Bacteroides thetaiotaomicron]|nr:carboxypeptidase-like regulatory domain-containing protein [Bacteroides thetaiotaomicron]